jgi:uncharacterized membrane protein
MNVAHLHLLLNHWPIIGTFIGLGLFLVALAGKSNDLKQTSLAIFSLTALVTIPAYMTGNGAQDLIQREAGVSESLISTHEGAALLAFLFVEITGAVAWLGLWQFRQASRPAGWTVSAVLVCSVVTVGLMTIAGNTGGAIRHPEIYSGPEPSSIVGAMGSRLYDSIHFFVAESSRWVWPFLEAFHFLGLALLLGAVGILNLRLLGFLKQLPAGPLHRFIPWGIAGLAINTVTGILFFLSMPFFYIYNVGFQFKMLAVVIGGAILLLHSTPAFRDCEHLAPGESAPPLARLVAGSSTLLWLAVIVLGRYLPFFEDVRP